MLKRVARGEAVTVTRAGEPIAEMRAIRRGGLSATALLTRWHKLPAVDPVKLRADLDRLLDTFA